MTVTQALQVIRSAPRDAARFDVRLVCGFTPLDLGTFLRAHLQKALPARFVNVATGRFGDTAGALEEASASDLHAVALALEWSDLDPRFGYRTTGSWDADSISDAAAEAQLALDRLGAAIGRIPSHVPIAASLPTLPLPPVFGPPAWRASETELLLERRLAAFACEIAKRRGLALVNRIRLAEESPAAARYDLKSDLLTGLPYTVRHADRVAAALARIIAPPAPKKGIITDLDDTLWNGIVGEVGPDGVSWDFASHHHLHALYQKLLSSLAGQGVLIAVASKNDPGVVEEAFRRQDLALRPERVFPIEANWNAKSASVARILQAWNIAADSVVFIDDSPMELAEVAEAHPGIHCLRFPKGDYAAGLAMLRELRDLCGKEQASQEDAFRLDSIRRNVEFQSMAANGAAPEEFLERAGSSVIFEFSGVADDSRVLELVNKTNQFNLNGIRYSEADWRRRLARPGAFVAAVSYADKFGPLGKIMVVEGERHGERLSVAVWVMSCRAFARRIEYQCLRTLFERFQATQIRFEFASTPRNGPLQEFFKAILGEAPESDFSLTREQFDAACPRLYHDVKEFRENA